MSHHLPMMQDTSHHIQKQILSGQQRKQTTLPLHESEHQERGELTSQAMLLLLPTQLTLPMQTTLSSHQVLHGQES